MFITENTIAGLSGNYTVVAADGYSGGIGCQFAALEATQTDFSFLTAFVQSDAREIGMIREGADDYEVNAMLEGTISDAWNKLKQWIKKIWEKIKGIFKAFIARLEDFMGKNGYAYYEKYKKILFDGTPIKDLKAKYSKVQTDKLKTFLTGVKMGEFFDDARTSEIARKITDDTDQSDIVDEYLTKLLGESTDKKSFKKDFHDACFDSEATEDLEVGNIPEYVKYIATKKSIIEDFEKQRNSIDKGLNLISRDFDKMADLATKAVVDGAKSDAKTVDFVGRHTGFEKNKEGKDNKALINAGKDSNGQDLTGDDRKTSQKDINIARRAIGALQSALVTYNSSAMEAGKFAIAQSRRLAAVIVAYKMRHKNEGFAGVEMSDELYTIIGEAAEYEALSAMDDLAIV